MSDVGRVHLRERASACMSTMHLPTRPLRVMSDHALHEAAATVVGSLLVAVLVACKWHPCATLCFSGC